MEDSRACPEETIYQLGTKDGYEDPAVFVKVVTELFEVIQEKVSRIVLISNFKMACW